MTYEVAIKVKGGISTGTYEGEEPTLGDVIEITLCDENGNKIMQTGKLVEIF